MNSIGGMSITGLSIITSENYNSIPGLKLWLDSRERVEVSGGRIPLWGDKSPLITNMSATVARQANYVSPFVESNPSVGTEGFNSNSKNYSFLHNGSAFGFYSILKCDLTEFANSVNLFQTYSTNNGIRILLSRGTGTGRIFIDVWKDGVAVIGNTFSNIATSQPSNVIIIFKNIYKGLGVTNNINVKYGNYSYLGTNAATSFSTNLHDTILFMGNSNLNKSFKTGINLVYDWTGVPSATIDANDLKIMAMLEKDKLIFQNLDI